MSASAHNCPICEGRMAESFLGSCPKNHTFHFPCIFNRIRQDQTCPECETVVAHITDSGGHRHATAGIYRGGARAAVPVAPARSGRSSRWVWSSDEDEDDSHSASGPVAPAWRVDALQLSPSSGSSGSLSSDIQTSFDSNSDGERLPLTPTGSDVLAQAGPGGDGYDSLGAPALDTPSAAAPTPDAIIELLRKINCTICIGPMGNGTTSNILRCGHAFHEECINRWLRGNQTCPNCRGARHP